MTDVERLAAVRAVCERVLREVGPLPPNATWSDDEAGAEVAREILEVLDR